MNTIKKILQNKYVHVLLWILGAVVGGLLVLNLAQLEVHTIVRMGIAIGVYAVAVPAVWSMWKKFGWFEKDIDDGDKVIEKWEIIIKGIVISALAIGLAMIIGNILNGAYLGNMG